jgi:hypothetical protein
MRTVGNGQGLPMRFLRKTRRAHVGHPNLDWAKPLVAKALAVRPNFVSGRLGMSACWHDDYTLLVTCNLSQVAADCYPLGARCSECHSYHDWTKEKPVKGTYTVPELRAAK